MEKIRTAIIIAGILVAGIAFNTVAQTQPGVPQDFKHEAQAHKKDHKGDLKGCRKDDKKACTPILKPERHKQNHHARRPKHP